MSTAVTPLMAYWRRVREKEKQLHELYPDASTIHLILRDDKGKHLAGGTIHMAAIDLAAKCIVDGSHSIASPGQIAKYKADQELAALAQEAYQSQIDKQNGVRTETRFRAE
jgi:hypothetical protein